MAAASATAGRHGARVPTQCVQRQRRPRREHHRDDDGRPAQARQARIEPGHDGARDTGDARSTAAQASPPRPSRLARENVRPGSPGFSARRQPPRLRQRDASRRLLDRLADAEQRLLVERPADQLQAERQALRVEARPAPTMPGRPAMFTVTVNMSLRYISTGSPRLLADAEGGRRRRSASGSRRRLARRPRRSRA